MKHSKQVTKYLFINNLQKVVGSFFLMTVCCLALAGSSAFASPQEMGEVSVEDFKESKKSPAGGKVYSPYLGRAYPDRVFFGDTHLHTNLSPDADWWGPL